MRSSSSRDVLGRIRRHGRPHGPVIARGLAMLWAATLVSPAHALALPAPCAQAGSTVTCTYTSGVSQFTVPAGVSTVHVGAVGGAGAASSGVPGGAGASVTGTVSVTPGTSLAVDVGVSATDGSGGASAYGPGGSGCGGGGGASAVVGAAPILVAAGGGGAGCTSTTDGGAGGAAGAAGSPGAPFASIFLIPGGAGGSAGSQPGPAGGDAAPAGGTLDNYSAEGGGGGGGYRGGGPGAVGSITSVGLTIISTTGGGGGGGGSNVVPPGGTAGTVVSGEPPSVTISYTAPTPTISFTSGLPPSGTGGHPYSYTYTATGDGGITFSRTAGALPPGLTLSSGGVLSGTPTTVGSFTFTVTATGSSGASASRQDTVEIRDGTAPAITITTPQDGATYTLGQAVMAGYSCADETGGSGLASCTGTVPNGSRIDTGSVGNKQFTVTASDNAGNTTSRTVTYTVGYAFTGFFAPVADPPEVNLVKAGSAVPVKFSLGGDQGLNVFSPGSPASQQVACASGAPLETLTATVTAGSSSLSYDPSTGTYTYVWKTNAVWAGTCRDLDVQLADGTHHRAHFQFRAK